MTSQTTSGMKVSERLLEEDLIAKLAELKYEQRPDIRGLESLEANFRDKAKRIGHL